MIEPFLNGKVTLHPGNCLDVLVRLDECSIDSVVTDPPYHLTSIVKRFGGEDRKAWEAINGNHGGGASPYQRTSVGFMGKVWDGGDVAFRPETWRAVYRVLKPGAHLLAFGGTRTYHRMAVAIEDAGFDVRDMVSWLYGSGFPKSHDVSKGIDRAAGAEREVIGQTDGGLHRGSGSTVGSFTGQHAITAPATDLAREWAGWGTALKPALEPICMARKPLSEGTVAANVLRWGTGAINVDGCRVPTDEQIEATRNVALGSSSGGIYGTATTPGVYAQHNNGRWPANVVHDGSEEVAAAFPPQTGAGGQVQNQSPHESNSRGRFNGLSQDFPYYGDSGSAARFFYTAKADADDRLGSRHPTVKPVDLMQYLVRLVTPKGGTVLDPFAGTGTTGEAAWREGMRAVLIEAEAEYQADIRRRMALALAGPDERVRESIKARGEPIDYGPLFAALREAAE